MLNQIEKLAAENAVLKYIIYTRSYGSMNVQTQSSDNRGFEQFYPKGVKQTHFGFMSPQPHIPSLYPAFGGRKIRQKYEFAGVDSGNLY